MYTLHDIEVTKEDGHTRVIVYLQDDTNENDKKKIGLKWHEDFNFYLPDIFLEIGRKIKTMGQFINFNGIPLKESEEL